jgi:cytochrome c
MLFPERWSEVRGFLSSLFIANVIPRYLHFLTGTVAVTGLFLFGYFGRKKYPVEDKLPGFTRDEIKAKAYKLTFYATLSQLIFGPLLFFTLPWHGVDWNLAYIIIAGILIAAAAMTLLWLELKRKNLGRRFGIILILISITVLLMGWGRHTYRENVIEPHKKLMQEHR